jgi:hypothetical protein
VPSVVVVTESLLSTASSALGSSTHQWIHLDTGIGIQADDADKAIINRHRDRLQQGGDATALRSNQDQRE